MQTVKQFNSPKIEHFEPYGYSLRTLHNLRNAHTCVMCIFYNSEKIILVVNLQVQRFTDLTSTGSFEKALSSDRYFYFVAFACFAQLTTHYSRIHNICFPSIKLFVFKAFISACLRPAVLLFCVSIIVNGIYILGCGMLVKPNILTVYRRLLKSMMGMFHYSINC